MLVDTPTPATGAARQETGEKDGAVRATDLAAWPAYGLVALTVLGLLATLSPGLIFEATLVGGGDLGAHVFPLREFVERLIPAGAVTGWTHAWFAGMPLFYFYFPLPALIVAALEPLAGFEVAVKMMVALGPLTLPVAVFAVLRGAGFSRWQSVGGMLMAAAFLFMTSYDILGANLLSTYIGEFAYSISFTLSLFYVAVVLRAGRTRRAAPLAAAVLLALTALSHVLTTAFVVAITLPLVVDERYSRTVLMSWVVGFLLAGFWAFPFLARFEFMAGSIWLHSRSATELVPLEIVPLLPFAAYGCWWSWRNLRTTVLPLILAPFVAVCVYLLPQEFFHSARLLPFAFLVVHMLAGVAVGTAMQRAIVTRAWKPVALATVGVWLVGLMFFGRDVGHVADRVRSVNAGVEAAPHWERFDGVVQAISALPPGRVFWEESQGTIEHGTGMGLNMLPHWSAQHPVLTGLWAESSHTYPFARRMVSQIGLVPSQPGALAQVLEQAKHLGGRYFLAFSDSVRARASQSPQLLAVAESEEWTVYQVNGVELISVADTEPVVFSSRDFHTAASDWFDATGESRPLLTASGPSGWPRVESDLAGMERSEPLSSSRAPVTDLAFEPDRISFKTDAVGQPHLVRASFFPNWAVIGADGPYRAAPSFMVVVPTQEEVELVFLDTWVEWTGRGLTVLGLLMCMLMAAVPARASSRGPRRVKVSIPSYGRRR